MSSNLIPDLTSLKYNPQNFGDLAKTEFGHDLWTFLKLRDNLIRMETATILDRVAVEPLSTNLVIEFGEEVRDDRIKQMIGHMARQIMEALGYELDRTGLRITRPSLFTSGTSYRRPDQGDRKMKISREQREAWVKNTANSPFNIWLNRLVKRPDGTLDLEKLYEVARRYEITKRYDNLNAGQQRMNIGVMLRSRVPSKEYEMHSAGRVF